ncbi:hypothetical protein [Mesorhizobium captivum]|nr:hypothetical protein [Mesorhizobium sp. VK3C]MDX8447957.1 hypothetical protein [Mesorhizobium sp. VK3C]
MTERRSLGAEKPNRDAEDLAAMVRPGTKVDFKDETAQDGQAQ